MIFCETDSIHEVLAGNNPTYFLHWSNPRAGGGGGDLRPWSSLGWLCHWNSIVDFFQSQATVPNPSRHCTPSTRSSPINGREYRVRVNTIAWMVIGTSSNRPLQFKGLSFATFMINGWVGMTVSRKRPTIRSLMKLWVDSLSMSATRFWRWIVTGTFMVRGVVHPVRAWREISGSSKLSPSSSVHSPSSKKNYGLQQRWPIRKLLVIVKTEALRSSSLHVLTWKAPRGVGGD